MSLKNVKIILIRAATDPNFRSRLLNEAEKVLQEYELTQEEKQTLERLSVEQLSNLSVKNTSKDFYLSDIRI